ncbi:hypothetical protein TSUD_41950 [Trifolium subterraneum]|nr:hypothetical protein TSUD_41950 [Trifolium subterraneum]
MIRGGLGTIAGVDEARQRRGWFSSWGVAPANTPKISVFAYDELEEYGWKPIESVEWNLA